MKYEVTYHFLNGEIKKIIYKNIKVSREEFIIRLCGNNNSYSFFVDDKRENVISINNVCFFEIKEVK